MTENRFKLKYINEQHISANLYYDETFIGSIGIGGELIVESLNNLSEENEQLKSKNRGLKSELQIFKEDVTHSNLQINKLADENEKLKKDATTLIYANQDYRQQNINLQEELDYIQNSITNAIKHQKTELGVKALQEIIQDYNEWMLGHKEAKE